MMIQVNTYWEANEKIIQPDSELPGGGAASRAASFVSSQASHM